MVGAAGKVVPVGAVVKAFLVPAATPVPSVTLISYRLAPVNGAGTVGEVTKSEPLVIFKLKVAVYTPALSQAISVFFSAVNLSLGYVKRSLAPGGVPPA